MSAGKSVFDGPVSRRPVALVTGGAKRIGKEIAFSLARTGMNVAITYRDSADEAAATIGQIASLGVGSRAFHMNVRKEQSVSESVAAVADYFGGVDLLVNNAGVFETSPLHKLSIEQWDRAFETNTRGPFLVAREALPHLKAARGRIINLGSLGGLLPWASHADYCASKAALHMLTLTMAKAFAPDVSVNCVAPGWIEMDDFGAQAERFAAKTPMQRNGSAEDVAAAVLFFATGPRFVTGQVLAVDGGLSLV